MDASRFDEMSKRFARTGRRGFLSRFRLRGEDASPPSQVDRVSEAMGESFSIRDLPARLRPSEDADAFGDAVAKVAAKGLDSEVGRSRAARLVAAAAAGMLAINLRFGRSEAKGKKRKKGRSKKRRKVTASTGGTCSCTDGESPKGCPHSGSDPKYTCKRCAGLTQGSPQVECDGSTPKCICNNQSGCTVNGTNWPRGTNLTEEGVCSPVRCDQCPECKPEECPAAPVCKKPVCHDNECKNVKDSGQNGQVCGDQAPVCKKQVCYDGDCVNKSDSSQNGQSCGEGKCCKDGRCETCPCNCGPCEVCDGGQCKPKSCGPCETCHNGECKSTCEGCQSCVEGFCKDTCGSCEICHYGECKPKTCGPCEECHDGECRSKCSACEECKNGYCKPKICSDCKRCESGECVGGCGHCQTCTENTCEPICVERGGDCGGEGHCTCCDGLDCQGGKCLPTTCIGSCHTDDDCPIIGDDEEACICVSDGKGGGSCGACIENGHKPNDPEDCCNGYCDTTGVCGVCCIPDAPSVTCKDKCGSVVNNCGQPVNCGPCTPGVCGAPCSVATDCQSGVCQGGICRIEQPRPVGGMTDDGEVCKCQEGLVPIKNRCANNGDGFECRPSGWTPPSRCRRNKKNRKKARRRNRH